MAFERSELKYDFGDPLGEARACREDCALFDFSFLECARFDGLRARRRRRSICTASLRRTGREGDRLRASHRFLPAMALADLTIWRTGLDTSK